jgi:hypothetical protein
VQRFPYIDDDTLAEHQNFISECRKKSMLSFTKIMQSEKFQNNTGDKNNNISINDNNTDKLNLNITNISRFDLFDTVINDVIYNIKTDNSLIEKLNSKNRKNQKKIEKINLMELFPINKLKKLIDIQIGELEIRENEKPLYMPNNGNVDTHNSKINNHEKRNPYFIDRANYISKNAIGNFLEEIASNCEKESNVIDLLSYLDLFLSHSKPPPPASLSNGRWSFSGTLCIYMNGYICIHIYV